MSADPFPVIVIGPDAPPWVELAAVAVIPAVYRGDHNDLHREQIVAVVDFDPRVIIAATARGIDGIILDDQYNREFSWHFRAYQYDLCAGLARRYLEWRDRRKAKEQQA